MSHRLPPKEKDQKMSGVVVVGVDNSPTAMKAAECARDLAKSLGASLHVVTAFDDERVEVLGQGSDRMLISEADSAKHVVERLTSNAADKVPITHFAARGKPADALIKEALR